MWFLDVFLSTAHSAFLEVICFSSWPCRRRYLNALSKKIEGYQDFFDLNTFSVCKILRCTVSANLSDMKSCDPHSARSPLLFTIQKRFLQNVSWSSSKAVHCWIQHLSFTEEILPILKLSFRISLVQIQIKYFALQDSAETRSSNPEYLACTRNTISNHVIRSLSVVRDLSAELISVSMFFQSHGFLVN